MAMSDQITGMKRKRGRPPKAPKICQMTPMIVDGRLRIYLLDTLGRLFLWNPEDPVTRLTAIPFKLPP